MRRFLCRLQPFVGRTFVIGRGLAPQANVIVQEYGASVLADRMDCSTPELSGGWIICVAANESLARV